MKFHLYPARLRRAGSNLALAAAACLALLFLLELLFRAFSITPPVTARTRHYFFCEFQRDLVHNSLGFRDSEFPPGSDTSIIVYGVGDSFDYGEGVERDEVYSKRLAPLLNRAAPGTAWAGYNAGELSADIRRTRENTARVLARHHADIIVYGYVLNDPVVTPSFRARYPLEQTADYIGTIPLVPMLQRLPLQRSYFASWCAYRMCATLVTRRTLQYYRDLYFAPLNAAGCAATREELRQLNALCRQHGAQLVVMIFPILFELQQYPLADVHRSVAAWCDETGIPVLDLLPAYSRHPDSALFVHPTNRHPNARAHALAAEELAAFLPPLMDSRGFSRAGRPDTGER